MKQSLFALGAVLTSAATLAQAPIPQEFPSNATSISAEQLRERLSDRVFGARATDGKDWRWEWKTNGYIFLNIGGYSDSGKWRAEDGKVCVDMNKSGATCSEMRLVGDVLYMKRTINGEVIGLLPK